MREVSITFSPLLGADHKLKYWDNAYDWLFVVIEEAIEITTLDLSLQQLLFFDRRCHGVLIIPKLNF